MRYLLGLIMFAVLMAGMLGGVFAAAGFCACVWGPSILETALGKPPDRTHPAFWTFMLTMVPAMLVGAAGTLFGIIFPVMSVCDVAGFSSDPARFGRLFERYGELMSRIARKAGPAAPDDQPLQRTCDDQVQ